MSEREKLLGRVRMYDFALVEVIEYLDCQPHNEAALKYYREMRAAFDKASNDKTTSDKALDGHWNWIDDPWPWEGADN